MKRLFLFSKTLLVTALLGMGVNAWADCSVTTDAYGKTKVVWDFKIEAKTGESETVYYLDAKKNSYVDASSTYGKGTQYYAIAYAKIKHSTRSITTENGAGLGNNQGYLEFYAPVSGTFLVNGQYISNITIDNKNTGSKTTTSNTSATSLSASVSAGNRVQIYAKGGCTIANVSITPDDYETDVVNSGDMDFSNVGLFYADQELPTTGYYQISSKGFKTASGSNDPKDALIVKGPATNTLLLNAHGEDKGIKLRKESSNSGEFDYTTSVAGYLTVTFNYSPTNGTWYTKNSSGSTIDNIIYTPSTNVRQIYLSVNNRAQFVASGTTSIKSITFTEGSPVSVTVSSAGYATYVNSDYDLDFSATDIKAYKAQVNTTTGVITLDKVDNVPAGTPVILYKDGGATESIPVMTGAATVEDNDLKAGEGVVVPTTDGAGNYNYVLDKQDEIIGFYKAANLTVPTNRAYLQTTYNVAGLSARGLRIVFAGDITSISEATPTVEAAKKEGKFFKDGKLFIFKNGMKFNAAGQQVK